MERNTERTNQRISAGKSKSGTHGGVIALFTERESGNGIVE
jgi:hypothetical protein